MGRPAVEMTGERFGAWVVLKRDPSIDNAKAHWLCRCRCGEERVVRGTSLRYGISRSCGKAKCKP